MDKKAKNELFGQRLKTFRNAKKLSQREFCAKVDPTRAGQSLALIENGTTTMPWDLLCKIKDVYGATFDFNWFHSGLAEKAELSRDVVNLHATISTLNDKIMKREKAITALKQGQLPAHLNGMSVVIKPQQQFEIGSSEKERVAIVTPTEIVIREVAVREVG